MAREIGVGLVGYQFMGKAHSNAYLNAPKFFKLPVVPAMRAICGRTEVSVKRVARQWGWESVETDYRKLVARDDVDLVDVSTPNVSHYKIVMAAIRAGKHVACEKPLAMSTSEAHEMTCAAEEAKIVNTVWFNYRRCPAVGLARQMIRQGKVGKVFHVRGTYLQDWIVDPKFPLVWRLRKGIAGSGAHGDLNAHLIDLTRYITGLEFEDVAGMAQTFIKERPLANPRAGKRRGTVTVDDALIFLAHLESDAIASFEATRFATGRKNYNRIEINGSKGTLAWCFERMNELEFYSADDDANARGFRTIMATEAVHPYAGAYWPPGHIIGYEHGFVNQAADLMKAIGRRTKMWPDFADGLRCQEVLDAALESCKTKRWVNVKRHGV